MAPMSMAGVVLSQPPMSTAINGIAAQGFFGFHGEQVAVIHTVGFMDVSLKLTTGIRRGSHPLPHPPLDRGSSFREMRMTGIEFIPSV